MKLSPTVIAASKGDHGPTRPKRFFEAPGIYRASMLAIVAVALALRLYGYDAGLPSINDQDEPLFVVVAAKMLASKSLNPGWFGHPGATTFYSLALIYLFIMIAGMATGRFADQQAFVAFIYSDPSVFFSSGRLLMVAFGIACVILTAVVGRRLFGAPVALLAAALLAINPLHVTYSQIIRTDMQVTVFMLLCVLASVSIAQRGRLSAYLAAGMFIGLACATKWPAATIIVCPICACIFRAMQYPAAAGKQLRYLLVTIVAAPVSLFAIAPYLILDYQTVLSNLLGEFQPHHLGATGGGFFDNLLWYFAHPIGESLGLAGIALGLLGALVCLRDRLAAFVLVPPTIAFLVFISMQTLVWDRWVVPLLPFFSLFLALGIFALWKRARALAGPAAAYALMGVVGLALVVPMLLAARANATERLNDTRNLASEWVRRNVPAGRTVLVEHFAFDLLSGHWRMLIPAGEAGCIDAAKELNGKIQYSAIHKWRGNRAIVDFGTMDPRGLDSCNADFAVFSHYDRYAAERATYPRETAQYEKVIHNSQLVKTIRPVPGEIGGPAIRILRIRKEKVPPVH